ncbi:hypothetical protein DP49_5962 [Burkholderia pseudomallei]|nr:hypothetical protein DP49_5962 [Burkholderia pseudomallei]
MQYAQPLICETRRNTRSTSGLPSEPPHTVSDRWSSALNGFDASFGYGRRGACAMVGFL